MQIRCVRMGQAQLSDAARLIDAFLRDDVFYLDSSPAYGKGGQDSVPRALGLLLRRPELGFVWLAYEGPHAIAVCIACLAVSTSLGGLVCKLDDVYVVPERRGIGVGGRLLKELKEELKVTGALRIDTSYHLNNEGAQRFYAANGFIRLKEERLSCLLA